MKEDHAIHIKNLAELKRTIAPGTEFVCTFHAIHPDIIGLTRKVVSVNTVGFYSVIKDQPNHKYSTCNYGKGFFTPFGKASEYTFGKAITMLNKRSPDGSPLMTFEIYPAEQKQETEREDKKMSAISFDERFAKRMKDNYPPGTRIVLESLTDPYSPVESGMRGTVDHVDDAGTLHMKWDNGRTLGVVPGEDSFRKLTPEELAEEANDNNETFDEDESGPVMGM